MSGIGSDDPEAVPSVVLSPLTLPVSSARSALAGASTSSSDPVTTPELSPCMPGRSDSTGVSPPAASGRLVEFAADPPVISLMSSSCLPGLIIWWRQRQCPRRPLRWQGCRRFGKSFRFSRFVGKPVTNVEKHSYAHFLGEVDRELPDT